MQLKAGTITLNRKHLNFHLFLGVIFIIASLRSILMLNIPVVLFLLMTCLMVVVCSKEELIAYMCCLLPMQGIMQNRLALMVVSLGVLIRVKRVSLKGLIPLFLMTAWEMLHMGQSGLELYGFLQEFAPLIALTVVLIDKERFCEDGFIARTFAYATIVCSIINLFACTVQYGYSIFSLGRLGNLSSEYEDFRGLINPNTNSLICVIAICLLLLLRYTLGEKRTDSYMIVVLFVVILLTQSKSALLCTLIAFLMYAFFSKAYKRLTSRKMTKVFGACLGLIIVAFLFSDVIAAVIGRFSDGDISTGRVSIDEFYFRHIISSARYLLFGTGLYNYTEQIMKIYPYGENLWVQYPGLATIAKGVVVYKPCHLGILEIVVVWGVPGLLLVYMMIKRMINMRSEADNKLSLIPLCVLLIYCLQSCFLGSYSVLHALLIVFVGMKYVSRAENSILQTV